MVKEPLYLVVIGKTPNVKKRCHSPLVPRIPLYICLPKRVIGLRMPGSFTHSHPYQGRSALMSAGTSSQRVPDPPTGKLSRLTIETNPMRHALEAFRGADTSRAPRTAYEFALLISPRLVLHAILHYISPNESSSKHALCNRLFSLSEIPSFSSWRK